MIRTVEQAVRYALLRGGEHWLDSVTLSGVEVQPDGSIELQRVPRVVPPVLTAPGATAPSGIALDGTCGLYLADAAEYAVLRLALDCKDRLRWPGKADPLSAPVPAGICLGPLDRLYVADPQHGRIVVLTTPDLNPVATWQAGLKSPTWLAADKARAIVVSDPGSGHLIRVDPLGRRDPDFDANFSLPAGATSPRCVGVDGDGVSYLACSGIGGISRYQRNGQATGSPIATETTPQALAIDGSELYVADQTTGEVRIYRLPDGQFLGSVVGFRGPVAALAIGADGELYIKTGSDDAFAVGNPRAACVSRGTLVAGPLDAGEDNTWYRVAVTSAQPGGTQAGLETYLSSQPAAVPGWMPASSLDELLSDRPYRYLWVGVTLSTMDAVTTPKLSQVEAETPGDSYLKDLPAVYAREASSDFLERLLDLAKSILGDLESTIGALPELFDPQTSSAEALPWLASWLGFEVPASLADLRSPDVLRALIGRLHALNRRRGTPAGVADLVEISAGVRPALIEAFRQRAVWVLGATSTLGFDTGLPRTSVDGLIVDESVVGATTLEEDGFGYSLFEPTAHRFTALLPAAAVDAPASRLLRKAIEAQKPAHTEAHLCLMEPHMRIGIQSRLGVDAIIAGPAAPSPIDTGQALDRTLHLADDAADAPGAVQRRARIGIDTRLA